MELKTQNSELRYLGYFTLLALLILSGVFFRERALFTDIAYQTFLLINEGEPQVMVFRYGAGLIQMLPWLALKLSFPLWSISLLYSMSFPLLYLFFYWIIVRVLKSPHLGWALVFLFTLIVYDGFYWPSSEQQQGLAFLLVFWAFVNRFSDFDKWWMWGIAWTGIFLSAFYHPLIVLPYFFLWGYFGWQGKKWRCWKHWSLGGIMLLMLGLKSRLAANWYDNQKYGTFFSNLVDDFPDYFSYPSHVHFLENSLYYWYALPIALIAVSIFYVKKGDWVKLVWVWGFSIGHLMLLHIGDPETPYRFYAEVNYMPLILYPLIPLLMEWARPRWQKRSLLYLFLVVVSIRLITIGLHHRPFEARIAWIEGQLEQIPPGSNRLFIPLSEVPMDTLLMEWSVAYESLLLSSMEHPDSAKTLVILPDASRYPNLFESDTTFFSGIKSHDIKELNRDYFRLGQGRYVDHLR